VIERPMLVSIQFDHEESFLDGRGAL
jgi:hypothetical protein